MIPYGSTERQKGITSNQKVKYTGKSKLYLTKHIITSCALLIGT